MPNPIVEQTIATVTAATTVMESARTLILSIPNMVNAAKEQAILNGATEAELQPFAQLNADLQARASALTDAITANTPSA